MAGIVGAIFNCGIELGAAVGLAVDVSIESSVERKHGGFAGFDGRRAAFGWQIACIGIETLAVLVFYRTRLPLQPVDGIVQDQVLEGGLAEEKTDVGEKEV